MIGVDQAHRRMALHLARPRFRGVRWTAVGVALALVAAACGPSQTPVPSTSNVPASDAPASFPPASLAPSAVPTFALPSFSPASLRWFCCFATGGDPAQQSVETTAAAGLARAFPGSSLHLGVVTDQDPTTALAAQIREGRGPDIVGPVGFDDLAAFQGQWLDLAPYIARSHFDLGQLASTAVDSYRSAADGEIGIPFGVSPSMLWYRRDLFTAAGLREPPHRYGDPYVMPDGSQVEWNVDTLARVARLLTLDSSGHNATDPTFDRSHIVQFGFEPQRDDLRGLAAFWGAGSLVGPDGRTVVIPDAWKAAWTFFYDGMYGARPFIMTGQVFNSQDFNGGGYPFFSGKVAMSENFLWSTYGVAAAGTDWDLAAIPSYNGVMTSPLNADTFGILKGTKNPDAAFATLTYLLGGASLALLQAYGEMPARPSDWDGFFSRLGQSDGFPATVDWQVARDSLSHADHPSYQASTPAYAQTVNILAKYLGTWTTTPGLDMAVQVEALRAELQRAWDGS